MMQRLEILLLIISLKLSSITKQSNLLAWIVI